MLLREFHGRASAGELVEAAAAEVGEHVRACSRR
jgi:hypothetical protein